MSQTAQADADPYAHPDANTHADTNTHAVADAYAHAVADAVLDAPPQSVRHSEPYAHTDPHPDAAGPLPHARSAAPRAGAHTRARASAAVPALAYPASGITPRAGSRTDQDPCRRDARV
ncbi:MULTISPECIES: hypothetical protein [Streptomyces]|uniref:hypothetical protein n=1 Tax=Streptomyces lycopersici TaxID=2974589 RepID=UPI0021D196A2|nr:hypothetical protein [Streptomyces sp. NEAU-383]